MLNFYIIVIFLLFILFFHQIDKKNACFISKINKICIFAIYNKWSNDFFKDKYLTISALLKIERE